MVIIVMTAVIILHNSHFDQSLTKSISDPDQHVCTIGHGHYLWLTCSLAEILML